MCQIILWSERGLFAWTGFVLLDKWEALCIFMQYEIELIYTFGIIAFV